MYPHYLEHRGPPVPDSFENSLIRPGEVVDVVYPEDARSIGKRLVEYRVVVQHRDAAADTGGAREYRATLSNWLCGYTDRARLVLRADTPGKDGVGKGSKVLVACISGEHNSSVILCGLRDDRDSDRGLKDSKVACEWEVNGLQLQVMLDGSVRWLRAGPRDLDGKITDEPKAIGTISVEKDGSVQLGLQPKVDGQAAQYLRLDSGSGKAQVVADSGLHVGKATDKVVLGSTYRDAEHSCNNQLAQGLGQAQVAAQAAFQMVSQIAVTIVVPTAGAVSCAPLFVVLATQIQNLAAALASMQVALSTFEGSADSYLSDKNRTD